jgi:hypothetical protein
MSGKSKHLCGTLHLAFVLLMIGPMAASAAAQQPLIGDFMTACKLQGGTIAHARTPRATALLCKAHDQVVSVCVYDEASDACHDASAGQLRLTLFSGTETSR